MRSRRPLPSADSAWLIGLERIARYHNERTSKGRITFQTIDSIFRFQQGRCFYCQRPLNRSTGRQKNWALEHMTPICRGGTNDNENLVIACVSCNKTKLTSTANEFLRSSQRLGAPKRYEWKMIHGQRVKVEICPSMQAEGHVSVGASKGGVPPLSDAGVWPAKTRLAPTCGRDQRKAEPQNLGSMTGHLSSTKPRDFRGPSDAPESSLPSQSFPRLLACRGEQEGARPQEESVNAMDGRRAT